MFVLKGDVILDVVAFTFTLLSTGAFLNAEMCYQSLRALHGLSVQSPLIYNFRGLLMLASFGIQILGVVILFKRNYLMGIAGLGVACIGSAIHVIVFVCLDAELRSKVCPGWRGR